MAGKESDTGERHECLPSVCGIMGEGMGGFWHSKRSLSISAVLGGDSVVPTGSGCAGGDGEVGAGVDCTELPGSVEECVYRLTLAICQRLSGKMDCCSKALDTMETYSAWMAEHRGSIIKAGVHTYRESKHLLQGIYLALHLA